MRAYVPPLNSFGFTREPKLGATVFIPAGPELGKSPLRIALGTSSNRSGRLTLNQQIWVQFPVSLLPRRTESERESEKCKRKSKEIEANSSPNSPANPVQNRCPELQIRREIRDGISSNLRVRSERSRNCAWECCSGQTFVRPKSKPRRTRPAP